MTAHPHESLPQRLVPRLAAIGLGALGFGALALLAATFAQARPGTPEHAIAMHGEPALPAGFDRVRYANPQAPRGGRLTHGILGTFDSINPFIVKGLALSQVRGYVVESLMARGYDEPFTLYGLLARTVETDAERTYVTFEIDPAAKFSDGKPVTPEDVIFSWQLLRDKGRPNFRTYYTKVAKAEALPGRKVRFDLTGADDRELPLILGLMPVLAKHAVNPDTFEDTTFEPIVGSGPYTVGSVDAGRNITFKRDPNYWGRNLAINRGLWNFDEVRFDFYRDSNSHFEAFKKGLYDLRVEHDPSKWETAYDGPAIRDGRIVKEALPQRHAQAVLRVRLQHPAADLRRHPRARGDRAAARLRMAQPQFLLRPLSSARRAISKAPSCPRAAGPPTPASAPCWRRSPAPCGRTSWTGSGSRR